MKGRMKMMYNSLLQIPLKIIFKQPSTLQNFNVHKRIYPLKQNNHKLLQVSSLTEAFNMNNQKRLKQFHNFN